MSAAPARNFGNFDEYIDINFTKLEKFFFKVYWTVHHLDS